MQNHNLIWCRTKTKSKFGNNYLLLTHEVHSNLAGMVNSLQYQLINELVKRSNQWNHAKCIHADTPTSWQIVLCDRTA